MKKPFKDLLGVVPVTSLVPAKSIQWGKRVGSPAVAMYLISEPADYTLEAGVDLYDAVVQVDAWAPTPAAAEAIADAVDLQLSGRRGGIFQRVMRLARRDTSDLDGAAPAASTPSDLHRVSQDYRVLHKKPQGD